jgi:putative heme-binding domain-containing protein
VIRLLPVLLLFLAAQDEVYEGDPVVGVTVYAAQSCGVCHRIDGEGVDLGPDLSHIGARPAAYLKQAIREPNAVVAERYRAVTVVTRAGMRVRGLLAGESDSTIQLKDMNARVRTFARSEVRELIREQDSLMPAFVMPATDVDNLVAYLKSKK